MMLPIRFSTIWSLLLSSPSVLAVDRDGGGFLTPLLPADSLAVGAQEEGSVPAPACVQKACVQKVKTEVKKAAGVVSFTVAALYGFRLAWMGGEFVADPETSNNGAPYNQVFGKMNEAFGDPDRCTHEDGPEFPPTDWRTTTAIPEPGSSSTPPSKDGSSTRRLSTCTYYPFNLDQNRFQSDSVGPAMLPHCLTDLAAVAFRPLYENLWQGFLHVTKPGETYFVNFGGWESIPDDWNEKLEENGTVGVEGGALWTQPIYRPTPEELEAHSTTQDPSGGQVPPLNWVFFKLRQTMINEIGAMGRHWDEYCNSGFLDSKGLWKNIADDRSEVEFQDRCGDGSVEFQYRAVATLLNKMKITVFQVSKQIVNSVVTSYTQPGGAVREGVLPGATGPPGASGSTGATNTIRVSEWTEDMCGAEKDLGGAVPTPDDGHDLTFCGPSFFGYNEKLLAECRTGYTAQFGEDVLVDACVIMQPDMFELTAEIRIGLQADNGASQNGPTCSTRFDPMVVARQGEECHDLPPSQLNSTGFLARVKEIPVEEWNSVNCLWQDGTSCSNEGYEALKEELRKGPCAVAEGRFTRTV